MALQYKAKGEDATIVAIVEFRIHRFNQVMQAMLYLEIYACFLRSCTIIVARWSGRLKQITTHYVIRVVIGVGFKIFLTSITPS